MPDQISFECPHCREIAQVSPALINETVDCPNCHKQFQAKAPVGRQVEGGEAHRARVSSVERARDAEQTLRTVHPVVFRNHLFATLLFGLVVLAGGTGLILGVAGSALAGFAGAPLIIVGGVLLLVGAAYFFYRWIQAISISLQVTNQRTIVVRGILSKSTNEVQHDDVRNIKSDRNVLERILNYGDIALSSSGQDDMEIVVHDIPDPQGVIDIIRKYQ